MPDYGEYGPDREMAPGGKALITSMLAHRPCVCDSLRKLIQNDLAAAHLSRVQAVKRLEAAARRTAKKAENTDAV